MPCIFFYKTQHENFCWFFQIPKTIRLLFDEIWSFYWERAHYGAPDKGDTRPISEVLKCQLLCIRKLRVHSLTLTIIVTIHTLWSLLSHFFQNSSPCFSVLVLFKIADFIFGKLNASPRIPKKRRLRSSKLSKCGQQRKHPAKSQRAVHALHAASYPFFNDCGKDE